MHLCQNIAIKAASKSQSAGSKLTSINHDGWGQNTAAGSPPLWCVLTALMKRLYMSDVSTPPNAQSQALISAASIPCQRAEPSTFASLKPPFNQYLSPLKTQQLKPCFGSDGLQNEKWINPNNCIVLQASLINSATFKRVGLLQCCQDVWTHSKERWRRGGGVIRKERCWEKERLDLKSH